MSSAPSGWRGHPWHGHPARVLDPAHGQNARATLGAHRYPLHVAGLLCLALLLVTGCGGKGGDPRVRTSGGLTAQFAPVPDPPRVGHDSSFAVALTENNAPVTGATVNLALFYRSLNQTGPTATCSETSPGRYEAADLSTGMNGNWEAEVTVARPGKPEARFTFPFTVAK
jgi:YtkA-like protein